MRLHFVAISDNNAWYLHGAALLLEGGRLNQDFFDVNPPLILYLYMPAVWLHWLAGFTLHAAFNIYILTIAAGAFWLALRQLPAARLETIGDATVAGLLLYVMAAFPGPDFGEREHLAALFMLPYLLGLAARLEDDTPPDRQTLFLALLAAPGFAMKPHFLLSYGVILALAYLIYRPPVRRWLPEIAIIGAFALIYGGSVILYQPGFLRQVVPFAMEHYFVKNFPDRLVISSVLSGFIILAPLGYLLLLSGGSRRRFFLLSISVVFFAVFASQNKGSPYQLLPALILFYPVFALILGDRLSDQKPLLLSRAGAIVGVALLVPILAAWPLMMTIQGDNNDLPALKKTEIYKALDGRYRGQAGLVLSASQTRAFPLQMYAGIKWSSRFHSVWMIPPVFGREGGRNKDKIFVIQSLVDDIKRYRPVVIALDKSPLPVIEYGEVGLDVFFERTDLLRDALKNYRRAGAAGVFVLHERNDFNPAAQP